MQAASSRLKAFAIRTQPWTLKCSAPSQCFVQARSPPRPSNMKSGGRLRRRALSPAESRKHGRDRVMLSGAGRPVTPGTRIGQYEIVSPLGAGGMARSIARATRGWAVKSR
jgi:hypothetical protein